MKIKYKLSIPILLMVFTFGLVTASSIYQSKQQRKITQDLNQHMYPVAFSLDDAYRDLYQVMHAAQGYCSIRTKRRSIITARNLTTTPTRPRPEWPKWRR